MQVKENSPHWNKCVISNAGTSIEENGTSIGENVTHKNIFLLWK